jgi:cupin fold WbuC family metalloprotein
MKLREVSPEVLFAEDDCPSYSQDEVMELRRKALAIPSGKIRICLHGMPDSDLHEMLIALRRDVRYPIHKCPARSESHIVMNGMMTISLYNPDGSLLERVPLGPPSSGRKSYLRVPAGMYHSIAIETEVCVFLEIKLGPFDPSDNVKAPFDNGRQASPCEER